MDQSLAQFHGQLIKSSQILFKLSLGFSASLPKLGYLSSFASYRHTAHADELKLTREEEGFGSTLLEHVATYTLAVQIDTALGALYPTRFESADQMLRSAAWIARLVRNSFAHNPFAPTWKTYSELRKQTIQCGWLHFIGHDRFERQVCRPRTLRRPARTVKVIGVYSGEVRARLSHIVRPCRTA
jgi:hypothetical protein